MERSPSNPLLSLFKTSSLVLSQGSRMLSQLRGSQLKDSQIKDSRIKDSQIKDSRIKDSQIKDSQLKGSQFKDSQYWPNRLSQLTNLHLVKIKLKNLMYHLLTLKWFKKFPIKSKNLAKRIKSIQKLWSKQQPGKVLAQFKKTKLHPLSSLQQTNRNIQRKKSLLLKQSRLHLARNPLKVSNQTFLVKNPKKVLNRT